jgi:hypothetical protein
MMLCQNAHIAAHIYSRKKLAKQCGAAKRANAIVIQAVDTANSGDAKEKRLATFRIVCPFLDPNKLSAQGTIIRRIAELELIAHEASVNIANALETTFQARMHTSPTTPGYASHRAQLCYHLTQDA